MCGLVCDDAGRHTDLLDSAAFLTSAQAMFEVKPESRFDSWLTFNQGPLPMIEVVHGLRCAGIMIVAFLFAPL
eukprot:SAG31_NODE_2677_length_5265_cov_15.265196_5_plen_73_part_00